MRSLRPGVRRSRSDQPHRRSGRSRVTFDHQTRACALHVEPKRNRRRSKIAVRCRRTGGGSEQRCQTLSASGGCSRAQIHRRTQDNGFDRHASIRVSGPNKAGETPSAALVMTSRTPPEALNPQKGNIMSIIRHEIRKISDVRRAAHALGLRYRLFRGDLPGRPDLTFPKWRTVLFVNGCFWHKHMNCPKSRIPKSNSLFWREKLTRNAIRDQENYMVLRNNGWRVLVLWECQIPN